MDYERAFANRVADYIYAIERYPEAMREEFESILEELQLQAGDRLLNIDGVASPVDRYLDKEKSIHYSLMESNRAFAQIRGLSAFDYQRLPVEDGSLDKVMINASLHHVSLEDRTILYREVRRILSHTRSSLFVVADVRRGSKEDRWLNEVVDKYNPNGHCGIFFDESDADLFRECGFQTVVKEKTYQWWFQDRGELCDFVKHLFYLKLAESDEMILDFVEKYLEIQEAVDGRIFFDWSLLYFISSPILI